MESFLLDLAKSGFGTAVALACVWLVWKVMERYAGRKSDDQSSTEQPVAERRASNPGLLVTPAYGIPALPDEPKSDNAHVTEAVCTVRQKLLANQMDGIVGDIRKIDKRLCGTCDKIDAALTEITSNVADLKKDVAVLKDRTRDR